MRTLRLVATVIALTASHGVFAETADPPHPLCLWDQAARDPSVDACNKRHEADPVTFKDDEYSSPEKDESPLGRDVIRAKPLGKLKSGDEAFLVSSTLYSNKEYGTLIVIWRKGETGGGKISLLVSGGYGAEGGISRASALSGKGIQLDVSFDKEWIGMNEDWIGMPKDWTNPPALGAGCGMCTLGFAHILYPDGGEDRAVLESVEITESLAGEGCEQKKVLAVAKHLPHTFTSKQFSQLIKSLRTCSDDDTGR